MASITYDKVYSSFFLKEEAYDLEYYGYTDEQKENLINSYLNQAMSSPYVRRLFATLQFSTEDVEDGEGNIIDTINVIEYELIEPIDEISDEYFIIEMLAYGMVYTWLEPKVNSVTNIVQLFGTSDSKFYSQATHLPQLRALLEDVENKQRSLIRDRGYIDNEYIRVEG